ncbi:YetF domain-containing protein [Streptomyces anandii]|uniref:YetF domain-containing protein n=1 Tax=Streptomyces anandii TaxID=285454 RepID=UPI0036F63368
MDQPVRLLVVDGRLRHKELRRCGLTDADVLAVLRRRGVPRLADVRYLLYETKGAFSVIGPGRPLDGEPLAAVLREAAHPDSDATSG